MAAFRHPTSGLMHWAGETQIAAACRLFAAQPWSAVALIGIRPDNYNDPGGGVLRFRIGGVIRAQAQFPINLLGTFAFVTYMRSTGKIVEIRPLE
jgi:hypothetical protein